MSYRIRINRHDAADVLLIEPNSIRGSALGYIHESKYVATISSDDAEIMKSLRFTLEHLAFDRGFSTISLNGNMVRIAGYHQSENRMVELTYGNHFRFGYNDQPWNSRSSVDDRWWVSYGRSRRPARGFGQECVETAKLIRDCTDLPIHVLFSGGADSEVALRAFVRAGIPVRADICRFNHDLNIHDISYAIIACESLGVPYRIHDLNILKFWNEDGYDYARRTNAMSPMVLSTMWCADQIDGYPVMGSGEPYLVKDTPVGYQSGISEYTPSTWSLWEKEGVASWFRHFMVQSRRACPGFFQYTPEIMLAFLEEARIKDLVMNRVPGKLSTISSKLDIYKDYYPIQYRPKYTGFERIEEYEAAHRDRLRRMFPLADQIHKTEYAALLNMLEPEGV